MAEQEQPVDIYLLPGTMCNKALWQHLVTPSSVRLHHLPISAGESIDDIVDNLRQRLSGMNIPLVGFSLGGYLAASLTSRYPELVSKLMIISNSPCALSHAEISHRKLLLSALQSGKYQGMTERKAAAFLDPETCSQSIIEIMMDMDAQLGREEFIRQISATTERDDLLDVLSQLTVPISLVYSKHDPLVDVPWCESLVASRQSVQQKVFDGKGHMLPLEKANLISNFITQWATTD
ncbi:hypothetical protein CS022_11050 [Veronia nyctiphanis]|uniref:AB hydrolase-1 domain-containing protein n=1 Tax=Veronia nyctiphanis TaxID=1278244 RepID=A0A4Q0YVR2_9GAMM|nr:alpha/beta hydrolase [Veronia nyctiphanis]RXJ73259.1 hypothetical protein CS022_11050 [Veronia nyctiphanis]